MREILIDGYNLIRQSPDLSSREDRGGLAAGRDALIELLGAYRRLTGDRITVVFDGDEGLEHLPAARPKQGVTTVFARPPQSADDVIVERLIRVHGKKAMLAVTSDRAIQRAARRNRIEVMGSEAFDASVRDRIELGETGSGSEEGDRAIEDTDYWERTFRTGKGMFEDDES